MGSTEAGLRLRCIQKGPETISDLGASVPNHSELEPSGGIPHRLGAATEDGGVRATSAYAPRALYDAIASSSAVRMGVYAMPSSLSALLPSN